jgi:uncharacterized lipoprotein YddW (UPF0748 family)
MKRRTFLELSGGTAALAVLPKMGPAGWRKPAPFRAWTWVHGGGETGAAEWRARFGRVRAAGISGVLVSGGDLELVSGAARAEGLEFHRWIWTLNRSGDAWVKENHPEWFSVSREGKSSLTHPPYVPYYQWLCPTRPAVRDYLRGVVDELAAHPSVDGVHLDYIRHPDVILPIGLWSRYNLVQDREYPEFDFCYCEACREAFRAQSGADPLDLPDPTADQAWREFRWASVTGVVDTLSTAVRARGKQITAAVFPTPTIARRLVRQAWEQWPLDAVFPMIYHGFYQEPLEWVGSATREGVQALRLAEPLHSGLYLPDLEPDALGRAIRLVREAGASGVSLFEMAGLSDPHLAALRSALRG